MPLPRLKTLGKAGLVLIALNELRGLVVVAAVTAPLWKGWF